MMEMMMFILMERNDVSVMMMMFITIFAGD